MKHDSQALDEQYNPREVALAARIIPPRTASRREVAALETAMANLALDQRHPVALELVGDAGGVQFIIRATTEDGLAHLAAQLHALYPQAEIVPFERAGDPWQYGSNEAVTVFELQPGAASYYALRTWDARAWERRDSQGADPILGLLAALQGLPAGTRAIAQLAMTPAGARWSRQHLRKAVEHPLEPEREIERKQARKYSAGPSMTAIIALAVVVALALIWRQFGREILPLIPVWTKQALASAIRGRLPALTPLEIAQLIACTGAIFLAVFLISRLVQGLQGQRALYDMRQVGEKTKRVAYRVRLRLVVIGPIIVEPGRDEKIKLDRRRNAGFMLVCKSLPCIMNKARLERTALFLLQYGRKQLQRYARAARVIVATRHYIVTVACFITQALWRGGADKHRWRRRQRARRFARGLRRGVAARLIAAYRQYHQAAGNYFVPKPLYLWRAQIVPRTRASSPGWRRGPTWLAWGSARWERGLQRSPHFLSIEELAALWHLPPEQDLADIPGLARGRARTRPVPLVLTNVGTSLHFNLVPYCIGTAAHAGQEWPVYLPQEVLHRNLLAVATTGKGKSTLFQHLALAHLAANTREGLLFMEPHGDTIATLLGCIPPTRQDDVTLIDLADETTVVGLNPLDMTQGIDRDKAVENILAVFIAFWKKQRSWGPRTENILQFALLTLCEANLHRIETDQGVSEQYTLLDVIPLLQQPGYRQRVLQEVHDPVVLAWWNGYYEPMRQAFRDEVISPVINKISKYAAARLSRRLLGQSRATIRLREDIAEGRVILINTASGIVGEELSALVGATLLGLFQSALAEQSRLAPRTRRRFLVFIDEFQTYLGIDYATMLAELRKYGGAFGLATQSLAYLDEMDRSLKATVLANIDHLFAFTMSADDARAIVPSLDGLEVGDVLALDAYTCYARLSHEGKHLPTFSLRLAPPPMADMERAAQVRHHSAERHARPVAIVDAELTRSSPQSASSGESLEDDRVGAGDDAVSREQRSARRRGSGKGKTSTSDRRPPAGPDGEQLSRPYVLSPRQRPRSGIWFGEDEVREERGEPGGE